MPTQVNNPMPSGIHTVETLVSELRGMRDLLQERDRRMEERFQSQQTALDTAARNLSEYKAIANEWRGALSDVRSGTLSRTEYDAKHQNLIDRTDALGIRIGAIDGLIKGLEAEAKGRVSQVTLWLLGAGTVISLVLGTIHILIGK